MHICRVHSLKYETCYEKFTSKERLERQMKRKSLMDKFCETSNWFRLGFPKMNLSDQITLTFCNVHVAVSTPQRATHYFCVSFWAYMTINIGIYREKSKKYKENFAIGLYYIWESIFLCIGQIWHTSYMVWYSPIMFWCSLWYRNSPMQNVKVIWAIRCILGHPSLDLSNHNFQKIGILGSRIPVIILWKSGKFLLWPEIWYFTYFST